MRGDTAGDVPLVQALRAATAVQHERVERRLSERAVPWTREGYPRLLRMTLAVVSAVEPALVEHLGAVVAAPAPVTRVARLRADLAALGCTAPVSDVHVPIRTRAEAWGVAYVIQGSLLGGALIARRLGDAFAPAAAPTAYLQMYGAELGRRWSAFCAAANAFGAEAGAAARAEVMVSALRTFDAFETALDRL